MTDLKSLQALIKKNRGCHGNGEITYSGNELIHENKNSPYSVDPREQFGTHENLSWGGARWALLAPGLIRTCGSGKSLEYTADTLYTL